MKQKNDYYNNNKKVRLFLCAKQFNIYYKIVIMGYLQMLVKKEALDFTVRSRITHF